MRQPDLPDAAGEAPPPAASSTVHNLATAETLSYALPPDQAIVAAYAQVIRGDYNTWDYARRYGGLAVRRVGTMLNAGPLYAY